MKALGVGLLPHADFLSCQVMLFDQLVANFPSQNIAFLIFFWNNKPQSSKFNEPIS